MGVGKFILGVLGAGKDGGRNVVAETVEVFRPNAEKSAQRGADHKRAALDQYAAEFHERQNRTWVDAFADGLNRLVRPTITLLIIWPIVEARVSPDAATATWLALSTIPTEYWALVGVVMSFYFGGRMQIKALGAKSFVAAAQASRALLDRPTAKDVAAVPAAQNVDDDPNPALDDWRVSERG